MSGLAAGCSKGVTSDGAVPFGPGPGSSAGTDEDDDEEASDAESNEGSGGGSESDPILTSGPATTSGDSITIDPTDATTSGVPETTSGVTEPASSSGPSEGSSSSGPPGSTGMSSDSSQTGDACADYAVWAQDCYGYDDGQEWCEYQIAYGTAYYGAACGSAVEELFACLSTQNCGAVGCAAEQTAANNACS